MYPRDQRKKIEEAIKANEPIEKISREFNIPKEDIFRLKEDIEVRKRAKRLIQDGKFEEATIEIEKLQGEHNRVIKLSLLAMIERKKGNHTGEKKLLEDILGIEDDDIIAMNSLIRLAREIGDTKLEKKWADRRLQINQYDTRAISARIAIAKREGDLETEKELTTMQSIIEPYNSVVIQNQISIARREGNQHERRRLLYRQHRRDPQNIETLINLIRSANRLGNIDEVNKLADMILQIDANNQEVLNILRKIGGIKEEAEEAEVTPLEEARRLIYESEDIAKGAEEIHRLLEGESELNRELVLAELYYNSGLAKRAERSLIAYRRKLDLNTQKMEISLVGRALELTRNSKTKAFSWRKFWDTKEEEEAKREVQFILGDNERE